MAISLKNISTQKSTNQRPVVSDAVRLMSSDIKAGKTVTNCDHKNNTAAGA